MLALTNHAWTILVQHINSEATAGNLTATVITTAELPVVGRIASHSGNVLMTAGDSFRLASVRYDKDAQGGRGDHVLTLLPINPLSNFRQVMASVNAHGYALTFSYQGKRVGNFNNLCEHLLAVEVKPGVTARDVIDFAAKQAAQKEYLENKGSGEDYGSW